MFFNPDARHWCPPMRLNVGFYFLFIQPSLFHSFKPHMDTVVLSLLSITARSYMEYSDKNTNYSATLLSQTSSPPPPSTPAVPPLVIMSPCAACKILRRRCANKCVLAPYFPPTNPTKFTIAHRVFGASNIIKLLQELPESQRADAVSSMVYEASARIRDPVYGCAGVICQLHRQINELQAQLARAQAGVLNMQLQHANLVALICMEMAQTTHQKSEKQLSTHDNFEISSPAASSQSNLHFFDDNNDNLSASWEMSLWA